MIRRLLAAALLAYLLGFALFAVMLPRPADDRKTDAIVVLTGGAARIERGLTLIAAERARRMLISGVARSVRPHELALQYRASMRLFDCCIDLGREAVDTRSNGEEVADWLKARGYRSLRLVTTDWHMRRASFEIERALPGNVVVLRDAVPSEPGFTMLLTEYNKYILRRGAVLVGL
ncbi:YdcF family protein [Sphingomonas flavalba]|uniref:YdcF family protein n=1 Tax=Sphingomonas flavalba TaxID=2559804 RepID=UPI0039E12513